MLVFELSSVVTSINLIQCSRTRDVRCADLGLHQAHVLQHCGHGTWAAQEDGVRRSSLTAFSSSFPLQSTQYTSQDCSGTGTPQVFTLGTCANTTNQVGGPIMQLTSCVTSGAASAVAGPALALVMALVGLAATQL